MSANEKVHTPEWGNSCGRVAKLVATLFTSTHDTRSKLRVNEKWSDMGFCCACWRSQIPALTSILMHAQSGRTWSLGSRVQGGLNDAAQSVRVSWSSITMSRFWSDFAGEGEVDLSWIVKTITRSSVFKCWRWLSTIICETSAEMVKLSGGDDW